ncbi:IclR family transcriptional regulator [Microbacterium sp. NPDC091313]
MSSLAEWNSPAAPVPSAPGSVLERIMAVLDAVKTAPRALTVTDIAAMTGLPKSTASRLIADLAERGLLSRTDAGITLGLRLFELGMRAELPRRLIAAAAPVIRRLREVTGERIGVWVHHGSEMVSVVTVPGRVTGLSARVGMRSPLVSTASGKAYLAFSADEALVERVCAPLVPEAAARLRAELSTVRTDVTATDHGDAYPGVTAVASPVLDARRVVLGAISVAGPTDGTDAARLAPLVRAAGVSLTRRLAAA